MVPKQENSSRGSRQANAQIIFDMLGMVAIIDFEAALYISSVRSRRTSSRSIFPAALRGIRVTILAFTVP